MSTVHAGARALWTGLMSPGIAVLLLFFLIPLVVVIAFSFGTVNDLNQPVLGFSTANYTAVFKPYNLAPVWRTIWFTAVATGVCLLLGYPVAYLAARFAGRLGPVIIALVVLPWLVDYLVRIYAWQSILTPNGLLPSAMDSLGLGRPNLAGNNITVIIGLVYGYLPLMILPIYAAVRDLPGQVIDAGKDLYGSPFSVFRAVTLPLTREGVLGGCLLVSLPMLGDFATAQFLGGPDSTMLGNTINQQFTGGGSQTVGAAFTVVLIALLALVLVMVRVIGRRRIGATVLGPEQQATVAVSG
ncbi:MAG: ABC transporter permease [Actinobacteria bacterium]|nr:ABC transporter permease [Actinomycetota bacterium]